MNQNLRYLDRFRACPEGRDWVRGFPNDCSPERLWAWCVRGDWMVWWLCQGYLIEKIPLPEVVRAVYVALRAQITEPLPEPLARGLEALGSGKEAQHLAEVAAWQCRVAESSPALSAWAECLYYALRMNCENKHPIQVCYDAICAVPDTSLNTRAAADAIRTTIPWSIASKPLETFA
jgi:hypothetical protein